MITVLLVVHSLIAVVLIGVVLFQPSEGGALGGLGGSSFGGMLTARQGSNLLSRTTAILAVGFFLSSLTLAWLATGNSQRASILDAGGAPAAQETPAPEPEPEPEPETPSAPVNR